MTKVQPVKYDDINQWNVKSIVLVTETSVNQEEFIP